MKSSNIQINNRKARFTYELQDQYVAGIQLLGTEVKSIREGRASIGEAYCYLNRGELYVKGMHIADYANAGFISHDTTRERKLLLNKKELKKITRQTIEPGVTIVPLRLFLNEKGWAKLLIAVAKGKKMHDKRQTLKNRENKRNLDRIVKKYNKR